MDESYQAYVNRVMRLMLPEIYQSKLPYIQESPKFQPTSTGERRAVPFPGYTVMTPPWADETTNGAFYQHLASYQTLLCERLGKGMLIPVPADSFHFTLADLIWANAYRHAVESSDFDANLQSCMAQSFRDVPASVKRTEPVRWQALGLDVRTRSISVCLAPKGEDAYDRIVAFRRAIYQNSDLMALGIEQQYHFTAHVTLGYFGEVPPGLDQDQEFAHQFADRVAAVLTELNQQWLDSEPQEMLVERAELRKFDNMLVYYRQPNWPVFQFS